MSREREGVPLTATIAGARVITRGRNCYIMDPWRTNKRYSTKGRIEREERLEEGDEEGMQGTTGGPTIDGIKSAKERWLAVLAARKATSWSRNPGAKEADTIHNRLGEPARRSNATPNGNYRRP